MTISDTNTVLLFLVICAAVAALAVVVDPKCSGWLGKRLYIHSCAQKEARRTYQAEKKRLRDGALTASVDAA